MCGPYWFLIEITNTRQNERASPFSVVVAVISSGRCTFDRSIFFVLLVLWFSIVLLFSLYLFFLSLFVFFEKKFFSCFYFFVSMWFLSVFQLMSTFFTVYNFHSKSTCQTNIWYTLQFFKHKKYIVFKNMFRTLSLQIITFYKYKLHIFIGNKNFFWFSLIIFGNTWMFDENVINIFFETKKLHPMGKNLRHC